MRSGPAGKAWREGKIRSAGVLPTRATGKQYIKPRQTAYCDFSLRPKLLGRTDDYCALLPARLLIAAFSTI
jgi:hypothetical protein